MRGAAVSVSRREEGRAGREDLANRVVLYSYRELTAAAPSLVALHPFSFRIGAWELSALSLETAGALFLFSLMLGIQGWAEQFFPELSALRSQKKMG